MLGSMNVLDPNNSYTSSVHRIIFVTVIDCVVDAVVEQVYSSAVTCSGDTACSEGATTQSAVCETIQDKKGLVTTRTSVPRNAFYFFLSQNAPKCLWRPGSPDPLGELSQLTPLPQIPKLD